MPTLDGLKQKWFIDVGDTSTFPPQSRHAGSRVSPSTDNNRVQALRDGAMFMGKWADAVDAMRTGGAPSACEVWITGWRLEGVETRGHDKPESDALDMLKAADIAGVRVYGMISRHMPGLTFNYPTLLWLNANNMWGITVDNRFPTRGSGHQKFSCLRDPNHRHCLLGSIDISKTRWDTVFHDFHSLQRNPWFGKPTHDTGVLVEGPAVADIESTFQERWDDPTRTFGLLSTVSVPPALPLLGPPSVSEPVPGGTHSVQVLHTYGRASTWDAYSWSPEGEFTVWASYLNAIQNASTYIYIEDQYFLPFGWEPAFDGGPGRTRDADLFYQLGAAIRRGVKVLAIVPSNAEDKTHAYQKFQRDVGVAYLRSIAAEPGVPGDFVIASLTNGVSDVYVHSKLMIVDDELVLIGSANVGRRSMTFDSEVQLAIVDSVNEFAAGFRRDLWAEHLSTTHDAVGDALVGYSLMKAASITDRTGHIKRYPYEEPGWPSYKHWLYLNLLIEPYGGPP
jgi:phosphatidylserine/phosphatidylglycerophosphate/cardiolipin synthase-like enzyme